MDLYICIMLSLHYLVVQYLLSARFTIKLIVFVLGPLLLTYTAHKKFMNGFACRGFDPYVAIISTSRCQKTPVYKLAQ